MKKIIIFCLIFMCIVVSSNALTAMPQGKFPVQILSSRNIPNNYEREMIQHLERAYNNSSKYRITNIEEDRIMLRILIEEYIPGVISTDWLASATPVRVYTIVWLAKPKNIHSYYIWHDIGRFTNYQQVANYIMDEADTIVWRIKNLCPYVFE